MVAPVAWEGGEGGDARAEVEMIVASLRTLWWRAMMLAIAVAKVEALVAAPMGLR